MLHGVGGWLLPIYSCAGSDVNTSIELRSVQRAWETVVPGVVEHGLEIYAVSCHI
jgi:hypothetical protein